MAAPASAKRKRAPAALRIVEGRGTRKDGKQTDSGGRIVPEPPPFVREAPAKPADLSEHASLLWDQVVEQMMSIGLLKPLDGPALEMACETYARWKQAKTMREQEGLLGQNSQGRVTGPWIGIEERAAKDFRSWAAEFGFTPAAEQALAGEVADRGAPKPGDSNPF